MMTPLSVLIVDDDPALLQALPQALRLRMGGVTVETAHSAAAALERIAAADYDAIVTDIKMPGMDGLALLAEIRTRRPDTPTLIITGHGENELVVHALRGGACDFIQKPIDRDYFVGALYRAIRAHVLNRKVKARQLALEGCADQLERILQKLEREPRTRPHEGAHPSLSDSRVADQLARFQLALADRYTIERELGRGVMATVYLAQDLKHHRPVAIKVLKREIACALGPERFLREIEIAARLNHPHILTLHDSGAYARFSPYGLTKHAFHHTGAYTIPNLRFDGFVVFTNRAPTTAMRGFGVTSVSMAVETHIARVAELLGMSPWELRLKNANRIGDTTANLVAMQDPSTVPVTLAAAERVGEKLSPEYQAMTRERRSAHMLPEHLVAQQAPKGAAILSNGGGRS